MSNPLCCRARFADCMCPECDAFAWETRYPPFEPADAAQPVAGAIDSVLSLLPARVERRRWAARALAAMRERGLRPAVADGALRVPMESLPPALAAWLALGDNRAAVEDLLDEEGGLRLYEAA